MNNSATKLFIAFEGIDGCGKSTQVKLFSQYLFDLNKHNHLVLTREPYKNHDIRAILRQDSDPHSQSEKLADLFIADRKLHVNELILPVLDKGNIVLTDRYKLSTITYQAAQGLDMEELIQRHKGLPVPDITFYIDVAAETAAQRMKMEGARNEHKFEASLDFLKLLRDNHHRARIHLHPENVVVVNGEPSPNEIFEDIKSKFEVFLREREKIDNSKREARAESEVPPAISSHLPTGSFVSDQ